MMQVLLQRTHGRADGTFGVLSIDGLPICVTLERQWLDNAKGKSCIPAGRYIARRVQSPKFGNTFEVTGVPNRDAILFHGGNIDDDSHGCILVGEQFNIWKDGTCSIASSRIALAEFLQRTAAVNEFQLEVINTYEEN